MITLSFGYVPEREAHIVGFGLCDVNLEELKKEKPISIKSERLGLPSPGCDFLIMSAIDRSSIENDMQLLAYTLCNGEEIPVTILHIEETFYISILNQKNGRVLYVIFLDDVSYSKLRDGQSLTFRARVMSDPVNDPGIDPVIVPVEVMMFWGKTTDNLRQMLQHTPEMN